MTWAIEQRSTRNYDRLTGICSNSEIKTQFDKYLPAVIDGNTPAKKKAKLTEGKEVTGNRKETNVSTAKASTNEMSLTSDV